MDVGKGRLIRMSVTRHFHNVSNDHPTAIISVMQPDKTLENNLK